jgi:hypothetical protein
MPPTQPTGKPAAATLAHADLTVRIHFWRPNLAGELLIDGQPATTFTGWLGLLTALDQALDTLQLQGPERGAV